MLISLMVFQKLSIAITCGTSGTMSIQGHPPVQTLADLSAALYQEWRALPQRQIQRVVQGTRRIEPDIRASEGYTRY